MTSTFFPWFLKQRPRVFENRATPTAASTSETGSRSMAPSVQEQLSMVSRSGLWIFTWKCSKKCEFLVIHSRKHRKNIEKNYGNPWLSDVALDFKLGKKHFRSLSLLEGSWRVPCFSRMRSQGFPFIVGGLGVGPLFAASWSARRFSRR